MANRPPVATNLSAAQTYTEDFTLNLTNVVITDLDGGNIAARLTLSNPAAGTLTTHTYGAARSIFASGVWSTMGTIAEVNALLAAVTFKPAANFNGNFIINTWVNDPQGAAITGNKAMTGIAINDAPVATNLSAAQAYATNTALNLTDIVVTDPDAGGSITARLSLSDPAAGMLTTGMSGAVTST